MPQIPSNVAIVGAPDRWAHRSEERWTFKTRHGSATDQQPHTKTGRWNQVLIMATAWLAQCGQHEPAPRFSYSIEPGRQGPASEAARIRSCMHKKITLHVWWIPCGSLPNPACLQVHDAAHGHLPAAFGTTAAEGVSISPFPTWDLTRSLSRPALRASSDITIVFINQHATSAPGGFNVDGYLSV